MRGSVCPLSCGMPAVERCRESCSTADENDLSSPHSPDNQHRREYSTRWVRSLRHWYVAFSLTIWFELSARCFGPNIAFPVHSPISHCLVGWLVLETSFQVHPNQLRPQYPPPPHAVSEHAVCWLLFLHIDWRRLASVKPLFTLVVHRIASADA